MPNKSRRKKPAASSASAASAHQEIPTPPPPPPLSQDRVNEKNELLEKFEDRIKEMKKEIESHRNNVNALIFDSALISAALHAVSFVFRVPTFVPSSNIAARISRTLEIQASPAFKEIRKILSDAIAGIKPGVTGTMTAEIRRRRCREKAEELEKTIKKREYSDELSVDLLNVIVTTLMPALGEMAKASRFSGDDAVAITSRMLEILEAAIVGLLPKAVINATTVES